MIGKYEEILELLEPKNKRGRQRGGLLSGCEGAAGLSFRVAGRRRDAIDGLAKNTVDVIYHFHGSRDGYDRIHPGAAANAVEFIEAQFANIVAHVIPLCLRRDHSLMHGGT
jgi:hypothetical protein